ncbi:MAG: peptidoglycan editing factor PgeF [Legionellaceae bacterium]|nr:peptidoglycan editing factor PgeF [Legionellaceae bacterium]
MIPKWPTPPSVFSYCSPRWGGNSPPPYDTYNMALHVDDDPICVAQNRQHLKHALSWSQEAAWLEQTHSTRCILLESTQDRDADAMVTRQLHQPLAILTADCLPILLCDNNGTEIAAIHAGWKGLVHGIIENTLQTMESAPSTLLAWIGPAICKHCYVTGAEVRDIFLKNYPDSHAYFTPYLHGYLADLAGIARMILRSLGISGIYFSNICTYEDLDYFSYRRQTQTGRFASCIWLGTAK